jgi:hypothetical protein
MYREKCTVKTLVSSRLLIQILYQYKGNKEETNVTFLGLRRDRQVEWKTHRANNTINE